MRPLNFPTSCFPVAVVPRRGLAVFHGNMRHVMSTLRFAFDRFSRVSFVQTEMLFLSSGGARSVNGNGIERFSQQFLIMHIRAIHGGSQRNAASIDEDRALDAQLGAIGRVFPGFFPLPAAPWSSPRPHFATPSRSVPDGRILPGRAAIVRKTRPASPTLESTHGSRCRSPTRAA